MRDLLEVVVLGRSCRSESGLKVRQPLSRMIVSGATLPQDLCALAEDELNVKDAVFTDDTTAFMTYQLKPQMRTLGKKYGKLLKAIGEKLATLDGNEVVAGFEKGELLRFELEGTMVELEKDDVLTAPMKKPGYVVATDRGVTVALDTNLTEDLIAEGFAREVISKLQTMRKEAGFEVVDRIHVTVKTADEKLAQIVAQNAEAIERGVLALDVKLGDAPGRGVCPRLEHQRRGCDAERAQGVRETHEKNRNRWRGGIFLCPRDFRRFVRPLPDGGGILDGGR